MWLMLSELDFPNGEKIQKFMAGAIPWAEITIREPTTMAGIAFPEENLDLVLTILEISREQISNTVTTDITDVCLISKKQVVTSPAPSHSPKTSFTVHKSGDNLENWSVMEPILKKYTTLLQKDIHCSNPHGKTKSPITCSSPQELHILFWSAPFEPGKEVAKTRRTDIFGIRLTNGQPDALLPKNKGLILYDRTHTPVAEYYENTLYILFDLPHGDNSDVLLDNILQEFLVSQQFTPDQIEERNKFLLENQKENYYNLADKRRTNQIARLKSTIQETESNYNAYYKKLVEFHQKMLENSQHLYLLENNTEQEKEKIEKEFNNFISHPNIEKLTVEGSQIVVITKPLLMSYQVQSPVEVVDERHPVGTYKLGKMKIVIYVTENKIRIHNLDSKPNNGYSHPHVKPEGLCCFGNIESDTIKLLAAKEFYILTNLIIEYLQTYNTRDQYCSPTNWPKVEDKKIISYFKDILC